MSVGAVEVVTVYNVEGALNSAKDGVDVEGRMYAHAWPTQQAGEFQLDDVRQSAR